jgi:hypothetical protein
MQAEKQKKGKNHSAYWGELTLARAMASASNAAPAKCRVWSPATVDEQDGARQRESDADEVELVAETSPRPPPDTSRCATTRSSWDPPIAGGGSGTARSA